MKFQEKQYGKRIGYRKTFMSILQRFQSESSVRVISHQSFVYDCVNKISPSCFHSFFDLVQSVHQHYTRQATKNDIFLTQKNTSQYGLQSVCYFGAKCWNDIPMDIKKSPSTIGFHRKLKAFLFENNDQNYLSLHKKFTIHPNI